jgi:peptidoglycan/LPS O-acetylase OafA/YrhL
VCAAPGGILWLAVPLILERNALWGLFRERHMLTADWSNHALLFVAYIYGFILAGSAWLARVIDVQWRRALIVGAIGTGFLGGAAWYGMLPSRLPPPYSMQYLAFWTLYAICAWAWMVGVLGAGRRWVKRDSPVLRYGRRVGYGLYIVHQPIIIAIAFVVVQWHLPVALKFTVVLVSSIIGTVVSVEVLSRIPVARTLLGLSTRAATIGDGEGYPEERGDNGSAVSPQLAQ